MQSFPLPTRVEPTITEPPDLGILPTSTPVPVTPTLAPTPTPLPVPGGVAGGGIPATSVVSAPPAVAVVPGISGVPSITPYSAFLIDPATFRVIRPVDTSSSTLFLDMGPRGMLAAVQQQDAEHPGYGYALEVGGAFLSGSPLPSESIRFTRVRWSPDGQRVAFLAETPGARGDGSARIGDTPSDGLWVWTLTPGQPVQFTHHALHNHYAYVYGRDNARMVRDFAWSPDGMLLLVELDREGDFPGMLALIPPDFDADAGPLLLPHEYGSWSLDGSRILVSGEMTDVGPILGWIDRNTQNLNIIVDGRALTQPLWMQDAVEMRDGRIAFLGAPYNPVDPNAGRRSPDVGLYIYNPLNVEPVRVAYLGGGPVIEAEWNAARTAVLVRLAGGRTLLVQTNGAISDLTATVGGGFLGWAE